MRIRFATLTVLGHCACLAFVPPRNRLARSRRMAQDVTAEPAPAGASPTRLPLPLFNLESVGLAGDWEEMEGNFILRPPPEVPARAVIHFLGGAFVGAAPHLTYRYLLEGLAQQGFLVVSTPYRLEFDYLVVSRSHRGGTAEFSRHRCRLSSLPRPADV
jgi:acetyl esterase/lipase